MRKRQCLTAVEGYSDSRMRLQPPALAPDDYQDGYSTGFRERLYEARLAIEQLKYPLDAFRGLASCELSTEE